MAKDKSKNKNKKKFKALEKGVGKGAKGILSNVAPRVESILQPERDKVRDAGAMAAAAAKPVIEQSVGKAEAIAEPVVEKAKAQVEPLIQPVADQGRHAVEKLHELTQHDAIETPDDDAIYELADLFKAFADATRLRILFALVDGGKCVADISAAAGVSQSATSHQLRSMKQANLVKFTRDGKQVIYSLANGSVQEMLAQGMSAIR